MNTRSKKIRLYRTILAIMLGLTFCATANAEPTKPVKERHGNAPQLKQDLKDWLGNNKVKLIVLIDDQGQTMILDAKGEEVKRCGQVDGTSISGNCNLKNITTTSTNEIKIMGYTPPPVGPVSMNSTTATTVDDPCIGLNIGGILYGYCW